jgi:hypothetical protein
MKYNRFKPYWPFFGTWVGIVTVLCWIGDMFSSNWWTKKDAVFDSIFIIAVAFVLSIIVVTKGWDKTNTKN